MSLIHNRTPRLSKSKFVAGVQCLKRLYLQVFEPEEAAGNTPGTQVLLEQGHAVGLEAQRAFPGGVLVAADHEHIPEALEQTARLIETRAVPAIFEATLEHNGVLVRVDILERLPRNRWRLIEVKSSTEIKEHYLYDVAIQRHVAVGSGLRIGPACLMYLNRDYIYDGEQYKPNKLFIIEDLGPQIRRMEEEVSKLIRQQRRVLRGEDPPEIEAGAQCTKPVWCEFYDHCHDPLPDAHVSELPRLAQVKLEALQDLGISTIHGIPDSFPLSAIQRRICECVQEGRPWFGSGLKSDLTSLRFPLHFMDFETFFPALPRYKGMRPYSHIPFQWSVHTVEHPGAEPHHDEFLADNPSDPRRPFITGLLKVLGRKGSVIVYNKAFESVRLRELSAWLPEFSKPIAGIQRRLWDLLPVISSNVYHPDFRGSFSIKSVLPALVPQMTYSGMEISAGDEAGIAWDSLVNGQLTDRRKEKLGRSLLAYCRQDTLAMVKVWQLLDVMSRQRIP